ncbi:hypothetical protein ABT090_23750 [Streptomyces asoensis]
MKFRFPRLARTLHAVRNHPATSTVLHAVLTAAADSAVRAAADLLTHR